MEQDNRTYFVSWYRLDGQDRYLLWWTGDYTDAVWVDDNRQIPVFKTMERAQAFAQQHAIPAKIDESGPLNLDGVKQWLRNIRQPVDTEICLTGWNFFVDAAEGTGCRFAGQRGSVRKAWRGKVYDKLFFGTTTGMMLAPEGTPRYEPSWNKAEKKFIAKVLVQGLTIFRRHIYTS